MSSRLLQDRRKPTALRPILALSLYFSLIRCPSFAQMVTEFRAVKLTNVDSQVMFSDKSIAEAMDFLAAHHVNVVLTVVWNSNGYNGNYTLFPSAVMNDYFGFSIGPIGNSSRDPLQRVIIEAHRVGIEVMPWLEMGFSTSYSQNGGHILARYPHWALQNSDGQLTVKNGFDWMSAINPEVQDFMRALILEACDRYDIDGIELSDRIPAMPIEGGYDEITRNIYRAERAGADPPVNYRDVDWKRWRAYQLTKWFQSVRDSIKVRSADLEVSSSPSVYPWGFEEYLQDSRTWVDSNIVDSFIPQLYRYDYAGYLTALENSLAYHPIDRRTIFFAGILMNIEHGPDNLPYVIAPDFLLKCLRDNRQRQVNGEAFFFYEGLRKNNNLLADTLKATYYAAPALNPFRNGRVWRPKGIIVNETDPRVTISGNWEINSSPLYGFEPGILINKDSQSYASVTYSCSIPYEGWFDVFTYIVNSKYAASAVRYTIYDSAGDSVVVNLTQTDPLAAGWQILTSVYLTAGNYRILKVENTGVPAGKWVIADAIMLLLNRKLSPDVVVTAVESASSQLANSPEFPIIQGNYPNPYNAWTNLSYQLFSAGLIRVRVYNLRGQEVQSLDSGFQHLGRQTINLCAGNLPSGIYFCRIEQQSGKSLLYSPAWKVVILR